MNAFDKAKEIEAKGLRILEPLIAYESDGRYVLTDKGRLSREMQLKFGDVVSRKDGNMVWAEIKTEEHKCVPHWQRLLSPERQGNLFLEEFSNLSRYTRGWLDHLNTDRLLYYFLEEDYLYALDFPKLKHWALCAPCLTYTDSKKQAEEQGYFGRMYDYPRKKQRKRDQLNDTWGRVVPINHLLNEIPHRILRPRQELLATEGNACPVE